LDKGAADVVTFSIPALVSELVRVCRGSFYIFCGTEQVSALRAIFVEAGITTRLGIWEKSNPSPMNGEKMWLSSVECCVFARLPKATFTERCKSSAWRCAIQHGKLHPTQKPLPLMVRLINASTNPGDTVLDNCMGSGTTGVACVNTGRSFVGIEMDPTYFAIAQRRIAEAQEAL
jgi:site-specific DNA-methyltransferase (adenine-specific)